MGVARGVGRGRVCCGIDGCAEGGRGTIVDGVDRVAMMFVMRW